VNTCMCCRGRSHETTLRSGFLIHWTGKGIHAEVPELEYRRTAYIDRLEKTLETGLWMMPPPELVAGGAGASWYKVAMTCFTEVLLTRIKEHAKRYGHLGLAFDRSWVISRRGSPGLHVRQHTEDVVVQRIHGAKDNTEVEAWNSRFKNENRSLFLEPKDLGELRAVVAERIDYYNGERRHSAVRNQPPLVWVERVRAGV
jgi:hypothetical protein